MEKKGNVIQQNTPYLSWGKGLKANDGYFVIRADFVIISRVSESKGKQALFL